VRFHTLSEDRTVRSSMRQVHVTKGGKQRIRRKHCLHHVVPELGKWLYCRKDKRHLSYKTFAFKWEFQSLLAWPNSWQYIERNASTEAIFPVEKQIFSKAHSLCFTVAFCSSLPRSEAIMTSSSNSWYFVVLSSRIVNRIQINNAILQLEDALVS
jgi:hypothetical protein